jgi:glycosyltransferase involved in cell wall biosynthesis
MDLSVIIPTLNRLATARLLAGRIGELLPALKTEVIVVTPTEGQQPVSDDLVQYVADTGRGVYSAYNAALRTAKGEYVWFMGDDDFPLDAASSISGILREGVVDVLVAPVLFSSGRIYRPTRTLLLLHFLNWCQQGVIYRRRELAKHRFFRRLPVQADQYVNILLRSDRSVKKKFLADPICVFGVNGISRRTRDLGYRSLRRALASRTLGCGAFLAFRVLAWIEPLIKRLVDVR